MTVNGNFTSSNTNLAESVEFLNHNSRSDMIFTSIAAFDVNGDNHLDIIFRILKREILQTKVRYPYTILQTTDQMIFKYGMEMVLETLV